MSRRRPDAPTAFAGSNSVVPVGSPPRRWRFDSSRPHGLKFKLSHYPFAAPVWFRPQLMLGLRVRRLGGRRLPGCRAVFCACLVAIGLAGCGGGPLRDEVIAQAAEGERIAFDVVKVDDAVLTTL